MAACNVVDHAISLATQHGPILLPDALAYAYVHESYSVYIVNMHNM